jgi:hypothetical protein
MDFKDLLTKEGLALDDVMVMRHRPTEPELRKVLPWLAAERPKIFNAYQRVQSPDAERALMKAGFVASFLAQEGEKALFVGIYRRKGWRQISAQRFWTIPQLARLRPFHMRGVHGRETFLWFDLRPMDLYNEWKGRLVVTWPPGRLWWRWAKSNCFPIHAIHEESLLDAEMPPWDQITLTWEDLGVLPAKWKDALRQWRGVYYIFDVRIGRGYVGSACGTDNLLGRWLNYASSGHGGNKQLRERKPSDFVFSILQRTSPDMDRDEITRLESSWKDRLHTRDYGLNDN